MHTEAMKTVFGTLMVPVVTMAVITVIVLIFRALNWWGPKGYRARQHARAAAERQRNQENWEAVKDQRRQRRDARNARQALIHEAHLDQAGQ